MYQYIFEDMWLTITNLLFIVSKAYYYWFC